MFSCLQRDGPGFALSALGLLLVVEMQIDQLATSAPLSSCERYGSCEDTRDDGHQATEAQHPCDLWAILDDCRELLLQCLLIVVRCIVPVPLLVVGNVKYD